MEDNGNLRRQFYYRDFLHLVERRNYKFASWIPNAIKHLQGTRDAFSNTIAAKSRTAYSDLTISDKTNTDLTEVIPGGHVTSNITDTTPYKTVIADLTETTSDKDVQVTLTTDPTGTVPDTELSPLTLLLLLLT